MPTLLASVAALVRAALTSRRDLALENAALRQQLAAYQRGRKRPRLRPSERALWALLSRFTQESAAAFFRAALERLVASVVDAAGLTLRGPFGRFADVRNWRQSGVSDAVSELVPSFTAGVLYLFDLGFFERALFEAAQDAGAHVLWGVTQGAGFEQPVPVTAIAGKSRHLEPQHDSSTTKADVGD